MKTLDKSYKRKFITILLIVVKLCNGHHPFSIEIHVYTTKEF